MTQFVMTPTTLQQRLLVAAGWYLATPGEDATASTLCVSVLSVLTGKYLPVCFDQEVSVSHYRGH